MSIIVKLGDLYDIRDERSVPIEVSDDTSVNDFFKKILQCLTDTPPACYGKDLVSAIRLNFSYLRKMYRDNDLLYVLFDNPLFNEHYEQRKKVLSLEPYDCKLCIGEKVVTGQELDNVFGNIGNVKKIIDSRIERNPTLYEHVKNAPVSRHAEGYSIHVQNNRDVKLSFNSALTLKLPLRKLVDYRRAVNGESIKVSGPIGFDDCPFANDIVIFNLRKEVEDAANKRFQANKRFHAYLKEDND